MESKPRVKMKTHVGSYTSSFVDFFEPSEPNELFESSYTSVVKAQKFWFKSTKCKVYSSTQLIIRHKHN